MLSTDAPTKVPLPFANGGDRVAIPTASQIGIVDGAASLTDGFPPLTRTDPGAGGIPPNGLEVNGILYLLSAGIRWQQAGGAPKFDAGFATAVGGYPSGAVLQSADGSGWWQSTADNNTANPDTGGAGWVPQSAYGNSPLSLASSNVTLTAAQSLKPQIVLTGTLTANINLIFPATLQQWLVVNNTTGAFTITAKTAAGTGVPLLAGPNVIYGDGANIRNALSSYIALATLKGANQVLESPGFQVYPWGEIKKRGNYYIGNPFAGVNETTITYPTPFPTATLSINLTLQDESLTTCNLIIGFRQPTRFGFILKWAETGPTDQNAAVHWVAEGH